MKVFLDTVWGPPGYESGSGGDPIFARPYLDFVSQYIEERGIKSVLDLGCGDGRLTEAMDWHDASYTGMDIKLGHDILTDELPDADLVLVKDVLQHWSNADIQAMHSRLMRFPAVLITNSILPNTNQDIVTGQWRGLNLTQDPFYWNVVEVFRWQGDETKSVVLL
jgi:hypothetical protein